MKIEPFELLRKDRNKKKPFAFKTTPGSSEDIIHEGEKDGIEILVCTIGKTTLHYQASSLENLHVMLKVHGYWMEMGSKDEK